MTIVRRSFDLVGIVTAALALYAVVAVLVFASDILSAGPQMDAMDVPNAITGAVAWPFNLIEDIL